MTIVVNTKQGYKKIMGTIIVITFLVIVVSGVVSALPKILSFIPPAFYVCFIAIPLIIWLVYSFPNEALGLAFIVLVIISVLRELESKKQKTKNAEATRNMLKRHAEDLEMKACFQSKLDADQQEEPFLYEIGRHANETLAIRYGIANLEKDSGNYPSQYKEAIKIQLQKKRKVRENIYEVLLTDFRGRKAHAVIEPGTRYIKTFLPIDPERWFKEHKTLEETLKGNSTMDLKELASFHVQSVLRT
jgi:cell division protein FtsB